jgi:hypothetical protein
MFKFKSPNHRTAFLVTLVLAMIIAALAAIVHLFPIMMAANAVPPPKDLAQEKALLDRIRPMGEVTVVPPAPAPAKAPAAASAPTPAAEPAAAK